MLAVQEVEGERAEKLLELCRPQEGDLQPPLFRLEGEGRDKKLAVVKTRGNEHNLEKVRYFLNIRLPSLPKEVAVVSAVLGVSCRCVNAGEAAVRGAGVGGHPASAQA